jgi:F-type H+-transporting ATPase subunit b
MSFMLLEINPLVLPDIGLVFWNTVAFLLLLVVLGKFAWKPILKAINDREQGIEDALAKADKMKSELAAMQSENEALLAKAREERATLIKEAKETADKMEIYYIKKYGRRDLNEGTLLNLTDGGDGNGTRSD